MRRLIAAALLALLLSVDGFADVIVTPAPSGQPAAVLCPVTQAGGRFTVGDKAKVKTATGGWNIRGAPDIDLDPLKPFQPANAEAVVTCVRSVGGDQWVELDFELLPDGWAREDCCDKLGPIVPPPPPPPPPPIVDPIAEATYYLAPNGDDANPGTTIDKPFRTPQKAIPLLKPGQALIVRGAEYDTVNGLTENVGRNLSIIPSGESWEKPVTIKCYPGEKCTLRRYLPAGYPYTEQQVRDSIHLPTYDECAVYKSYGLIDSFPYSCWQGSGNNQPAGGLYFQMPLGRVDGYVIDLLTVWGNTQGSQVKYVVFDGVDVDAKGITSNPIGFSESADHIRFQNLEIRYGIGSCIAQSTPDDGTTYELIFYRTKIHSCGVPFDKNLVGGQLARKNQFARYWHGWYLHAGGASFIQSESYNHAGNGLSPDGAKIVVRDSFIHDNSQQGIYMSGGDGWIIEGNVFYNNVGAEVYNYGGRGHQVRNNTIVAGPRSDVGLFLHRASHSSFHENNIISGFNIAVENIQIDYPDPNILRNNLIFSKTPGREIVNVGTPIVLPILENNIIGKDPMLDANYKPLPGSPAIKAASNGGNIGAR